jgi:hypothetical protein
MIREAFFKAPLKYPIKAFVQILIIHTGVWITKEILPHTAKTHDGCGFQAIHRVKNEAF